MDDAAVQLLIDENEIRNLTSRYAIALDSRDRAMLRSCFTDEIEVNVPYPVPAPIQGRFRADDFCDGAMSGLGRMKATQHLVANQLITVSGAFATCIAYSIAQHWLPNDQGDPFVTVGLRYDFELARERSGWKIRGFREQFLWTTGNWTIFDLVGRQKGFATR